MYFKYLHCGVFIVLMHISTYLYQPICYYLVLFYYLTVLGGVLEKARTRIYLEKTRVFKNNIAAENCVFLEPTDLCAESFLKI